MEGSSTYRPCQRQNADQEACGLITEFFFFSHQAQGMICTHHLSPTRSIWGDARLWLRASPSRETSSFIRRGNRFFLESHANIFLQGGAARVIRIGRLALADWLLHDGNLEVLKSCALYCTAGAIWNEDSKRRSNWSQRLRWERIKEPSRFPPGLVTGICTKGIYQLQRHESIFDCRWFSFQGQNGSVGRPCGIVRGGWICI